jgi:glycosyltransferase involved in cell wall biosynthesis
MTEARQSWTIIIFAYNEETAIGSVIKNTVNLLQAIAYDDFQIIIVNDGSTDNTLSVIEKVKSISGQIEVISHQKNLGIGRALLSGYSVAKNENICAIPADGQFDVNEIKAYAVIPPKTIISFYRNQKTRYTPFRKFLSFSNRIINYYLLGIKIKDVNWVKIYKKEFFDKITPVLTSSLVESEICAKMLKNNYSIIEVPSKYNPRSGGRSKGASLKTIFKAASELTKLFFALKN